MVKYINADRLIEKLYQQRYIVYQNYLRDHNAIREGDYTQRIASLSQSMSILQDAPTADVRENVRGKWIRRRYITKNGTKVDTVHCTECGEEYSYDAETGVKADDYSFCPNCGADNRPKTTSADMRGQSE